MASIQISFPDDQASRVVDAFADLYKYQPTVPGARHGDPNVPNPQSKEQFAVDRVVEYVKEVVRGHEVIAAAVVARQAALSAAAPDVLAELVVGDVK